MPSRWLRDLQQKHHREHLDRLKKMQPVVDSGPPRELPLSGKKEIERKRFREKVEKGNRALLDRLGKAMEYKNIDNERHDKIKFRSLQEGLKKVELARVTMENQLILQRIQTAIPAYDHNEWEREAEHREFFLRNMTEYPERYVPHYPPLRKKFLEEQAKKKEEEESKRANKRSPERQLILPPADEPGSVRRPSQTSQGSLGKVTHPHHLDKLKGREGMEGVTDAFIHI